MAPFNESGSREFGSAAPKVKIQALEAAAVPANGTTSLRITASHPMSMASEIATA